MCAFVLYDTQLIMEKRRQGDKDFIAHSVDLFIDFLGIFRRLMIILAQKVSDRIHRQLIMGFLNLGRAPRTLLSEINGELSLVALGT